MVKEADLKSAGVSLARSNRINTDKFFYEKIHILAFFFEKFHILAYFELTFSFGVYLSNGLVSLWWLI